MSTALLPSDEAASYAEWFACLAEPVRVRLLHAVAASPKGITVGALSEILDTRQATMSQHLRKLADVGFIHLREEGTTTLVTVNEACCARLPHAADAVLGLLASRPRDPDNLPPRGHRPRPAPRRLAGGAPHLRRRYRHRDGHL